MQASCTANSISPKFRSKTTGRILSSRSRTFVQRQVWIYRFRPRRTTGHSQKTKKRSLKEKRWKCSCLKMCILLVSACSRWWSAVFQRRSSASAWIACHSHGLNSRRAHLSFRCLLSASRSTASHKEKENCNIYASYLLPSTKNTSNELSTKWKIHTWVKKLMYWIKKVLFLSSTGRARIMLR